MIIRKANVDDITKISNLYCELIETMSKLQPYFFKESRQDEIFIKSMIENDNSEIFISCENDEIIGFSLVQEQETPPYNMIEYHKFGYIFDIIVSSDYKSNGIGKKLINECKNWCKERNLEYVQLSVLDNNESAIKFYESQNFKKQMITMYSRL